MTAEGPGVEPAVESRGGCRSVGGKIAGTLFFAVFLLMGLAFVSMILGEAARQTAVWLWPEVPCTVLASGVEETGDDRDPYRPSVLFEYLIDGRSYTGRTVARGVGASSSYDKARRPADRYPQGTRTTCRVNPELPGESVLERRPPWFVFVALLPLIFVVLGGGGIYAMWKEAPKLTAPKRGESISQRSRDVRNLGRKIELGVGLVFAAVGGGLSVFLLLVPGARLLAALDWVEVPAAVKASTVRSWSTDDGTSHAADVLYEYTAGGRTWRSNRRSFFPMSSTGHDGSRAVVDRYPAGAAITCFVDPDDASQSVLDRSLRPEYLFGLFPLVFLGAGLGLSAHAVRSRRPAAPASSTVTGETRAIAADGELELEPDAGPVAKVLGMITITVFWNGIVGVFVWQAVQAFRRGGPDWFLTVFVIPFVLVGLALVGGVFYTLLAAFNPRPKLTVTPAAPRLGSRLRLEWRFDGRTGRIRHLTIALEGHEKATYRRGTDSHTDREAFASFDLVDTSSDWEIPRGSAEIEIPEDTMHSFSSANNSVVWSVFVHGDIARWPDVSETFEIEVRPLPRERLLP